MWRMATLEKLQQIQQTLSEIDGRVPAAQRIGYRHSPAPPDIASFAASLLQPPATVPDEELDSAAAALAPAMRIQCGSCYCRCTTTTRTSGAPTQASSAWQTASARTHGSESTQARSPAASWRAPLRRSPPWSSRARHRGSVCPYALLVAAYERAAASGAPGASTAAIVSIAGGALRWAYVGDSGFAVLRGGRIVYRSEPQQRSLNSPFRLSAVLDDSDGVAAARTGQVAARSGDVVVVATNGRADGHKDIVAGVAYEVSRRTLVGKPDDITVLVAFIVESSPIHDQTS